ncbi:MAG: hypothetical protein H9855_04150 [Candidatus Acinetobacter avistercoris]|nr:hypothetical protein [Candidatus Acinetobacter avistercoris]
MKFKRLIFTKIYTPQMLTDPANFFERVHHYCDYFPDMLPEKCGFWSPMKIEFSTDIIESLIPDDRGGAADTLWCQRLKKPRFMGNFSPSSHGHTHSTEYIGYEFEHVDQQKIIDYLKNTTVQFHGDLAIIDANRHKEPDPLSVEGWNDVTPYTHELKHWLPDMYWGVVFGKAYVDVFGLEVLLTTPAYLVEKLSDEAVYIQLSPFIHDVFQKTEWVDDLREKAKQHLGYEAFWSPEKDYEFLHARRFLNGLSEHTVVNIPAQTRYTDVFHVPHFTFISDQYMQSEISPDNMYVYLSDLKELGTKQWQIYISQNWLLRTAIDENGSYGEVEEIRFFHKPDGYDSPIEKELFIGAWDIPNADQNNIQQFCQKYLNQLDEIYPSPVNEWELVDQRIEAYDGYSIIYLDKVDHQEYNLFRIASKVIVFEKTFVKVTFMDYWSNEIEESNVISDPVFDSFEAR